MTEESAECEPAWQGAGQAVGLQIWRIVVSSYTWRDCCGVSFLYLFGPGTDSISVLILLFLLERPLQTGLKFRRFKSERDVLQRLTSRIFF